MAVGNLIVMIHWSFGGIALPFCSVDDRFLYAMTCRRKAMEFYASDTEGSSPVRPVDPEG